MNNVDIRLKKLFLDKYDIEINNENDNSSLKLLGIDSLEWISLILYIEEEFNFDFYSINIDLMELKTFNSLKTVLENN